jgi:predicted Zn-dependent protease
VNQILRQGQPLPNVVTYKDRVGIFSLARCSARFWGQAETAKSERLLLLRAFKVLAHETGRMLSMRHCTAYKCLMNGSNSLSELDREPALFERAGLKDSVIWADRRLAQWGTR